MQVVMLVVWGGCWDRMLDGREKMFGQGELYEVVSPLWETGGNEIYKEAREGDEVCVMGEGKMVSNYIYV